MIDDAEGKIRQLFNLMHDGEFVKVELRIDTTKLVAILGRQARKNKCKVAIEAGGLVEVRVVR